MHRTLDLSFGKTGRHRPGHGRNAGDTRRAGNRHRSRPPSAGIRLAFDQASPGHAGITNQLRSTILAIGREMAAIPVISGLLMVAVVLLLPYAQLGGGGEPWFRSW